MHLSNWKQWRPVCFQIWSAPEFLHLFFFSPWNFKKEIWGFQRKLYIMLIPVVDSTIHNLSLNSILYESHFYSKYHEHSFSPSLPSHCDLSIHNYTFQHLQVRLLQAAVAHMNPRFHRSAGIIHLSHVQLGCGWMFVCSLWVCFWLSGDWWGHNGSSVFPNTLSCATVLYLSFVVQKQQFICANFWLDG